MPTYEYECESCGIHFDRRERFTAEPLRTCPECSSPVHRVIQPVGIIFKGSGWYCKDSSSSSSSLTSTPKNEKGDSKDEATESKKETKTTSSSDEK